jgi:predicted HTH transcriptional regulator
VTTKDYMNCLIIYDVNTQLLKMIAEGEHQRQDFKYCINDSRKIAISLVAFANTDGGRLLLGIRDNGSIAGVSSEEEYYMVEAAARLYSKPAIPFHIKAWKNEGKTVLEINIHKSTERPHLAQGDNGKWLAYIRIGDQNNLAPKILLDVWRQEKSPQGVRIKYTEEEQAALSLLQDNQILSIAQYARQAKIPKWKLEKILVKLIVVGVVGMEHKDNRTRFFLREDVILGE